METSLEMNPDKVCRTCLAESANMRPLFHFAGDGQHTLSEDLTFVTNMLIKQEDKLPKQMCKDCQIILHQSVMFKRRCIDSEARFLMLHNNENNTDTTEKLFVKSKHNHKTLSSNLGNSSKATSVVKNEQCFKEEIVYESIDYLDSSSEYLDNDEPNLLEDVDHLIEENNVKDETEFTCMTCKMMFDSKITYQGHIRDIHVKPSPLEEDCHGEIKTYICDNCNVGFLTRRNLIIHLRRKHDEGPELKEVEKRHKCSLCMRKFAFKSLLEKHLKCHKKPTAHICSICKREFMYRVHLDNHILSIHSMKNGLKCDRCPNSFPTQEGLEQHKTMHLIEKKYSCKFCSKAFTTWHSLREHLKIHTEEKGHLCPHCGKGFRQNANLKEHLRRHQGIKPFKCDNCERSFITKSGLTRHSHQHTGAQPHVCDHCGTGFTTTYSLTNHKRTHTGERPFECDLCPATFALSSTLRNHRRTHTGEKPFKCPFCAKAFAMYSYLASHKRTHTNERPYTCNICGQTFRHNNSWKNHLKLHLKPEYIPKHLKGEEKGGYSPPPPEPRKKKIGTKQRTPKIRLRSC